jgi:UDP-glucose 4-epimerase
MKKVKSIITGGAGFIGSHLADLLVKVGHEVIVLDNFSTGRPENLEHLGKKIQIHKCDLSQKGGWDEYFKNIDYVFHLAALADIVPSITNPNEYFNSNVIATFNVLEASKANKVKKIIYTASSSCYGIPNEYPTNEESPIDPQYPYALTKRLGEELILHWEKIYNINAISCRLFNVYGTRSRTSGTYGAVFGVFLAQKLAKKPFTIVGDGTQTRDFTYVTDVASALLACALSAKSGEVYNIGSGKTISINYLVNLLDGEKTFIPKRPGEPDCTFANIQKIKSDLNWQPKITIEEGVRFVLDEIDYWKNAPVWTPTSIDEATKEWFKYLKL